MRSRASDSVSISQRKIWQLKADEMLMVGRRTYDKLLKLNIVTIGDLANADGAMLNTEKSLLSRMPTDTSVPRTLALRMRAATFSLK